MTPTQIAKHFGASYAPAPFCILIDSREQIPLPFPPSVPTRVVRSDDGDATGGSLYPGDYSIDGLRAQFCIERKTLADLIGTLYGKDRATGQPRRRRFLEELAAMRQIVDDGGFACVVVTAPRSALEGHQYQSTVPPAVVMADIASLEAHLQTERGEMSGVLFKFYASPQEAARWVAEGALRFWRYANRLDGPRPRLRAARLTPKRLALPPPPKPCDGRTD